MAKEKRVLRGIVLRAVDTKEADKILTVLTAELGKISVVAKGARSRRSRVSAATQLLAYSELVLTESHGWQILSEASTIALFDGVRQDITKLSLASYFAELADAVTYADIPSREILSHLLNALYALGELKKPECLVKAAFELKLMALTGFEPLLDGCSACGEENPPQTMLDLEQGTIRCAACPKEPGVSISVSCEVLAALRYVIYGDPKRLYSFSLPPEKQEELANICERYVQTQLERGFRTLDFYKMLL